MKNPNIEAQKGDILSIGKGGPEGGNQPHFIVYLAIYPKDQDVFIGALLTHADMGGNIRLQKEHFVDGDEKGNPYPVSFDESFVMNHPLLKKIDDHDFNKVGKMSEKGVEFIEAGIAPYVNQFYQRDVK